MLTTNTLHFDSLDKGTVTEYDGTVEHKADFLFKSQEEDKAIFLLSNKAGSTNFSVSVFISNSSGDNDYVGITVDTNNGDVIEALKEAISQLDISISGNELVKARAAFAITIAYRITRM